MARQLALLFDDTDSTIHRLVHVGWNPELKQMAMPKLGEYLDLEGCEYATISDILEMRQDYLKMHAAERGKHGPNVKSWEQMDEHERNECHMFLKQAEMRELMRDGEMSFEKYKNWVDKLKSGVSTISADEEGDLSEAEEEEDDDGDDFEFEQLMHAHSNDENESENEAEQEPDAVGGVEQDRSDSSYDRQDEVPQVRRCRRRI